MSGGSMDYLYQKVEQAEIEPTTSLRKAFIAHLKKVAKALHDIEWVQDCDMSKGSEDEAIRNCLSLGAELQQAIRDANSAKEELEIAIEAAEKLKGGD